VAPALAIGIFLAIVGLGGVGYGVFALTRGGRGQSGGGIGPLSERGVHVVAGIRMLLIGLLGLAAGVYMLWSYFG
jgi:hypothetical protein